MRNQTRIKILFKILLWMSALLLTLPTCRFQETELGELPIEISQTNAQDVDVDLVVKQVQKRVQETLPKSYLMAFSFRGRCQDLPGLRGEIGLHFVQVKTLLLHRQVLVAFASVDTIQGILEVQTRDFSDRYWSTDPLLPQNVSVAKEVAQVAYRHVTDLGILDCDITMSCVGNKADVWYVLCTEPGSGPTGSRLCEFEIHAATGQIVDISQ